MPKRDDEAEVERIEQEASRKYRKNEEQIATALFKASREARQQGNDQLSQALLERALTLALPYILQDDQRGTKEQEQ